MKSIRPIPAAYAGLVALTIMLSAARGATWYVANDGDDNDNGTEAAPFQTVAHALAVSSSGDRVCLQRGGVFREGGLTVGGGRTLSAYGDPALAPAAIAGSLPVDEWTAWGAGPAVYRAALSPGLDVRQVYLDGELATLARYPDAGWLRTDAGSGNNLILDAALAAHPDAAPGRWTGAQVRWRKWSWWYETRPITADDGQGRLTLGGSTSIGITGIESGYFIDNTLAELDAPGEWYWDGAAGHLYLAPPHGIHPESMRIEAAYRPHGVTLSGGVVERIAVRHFTDDAVRISSTSTLRDTLIEWAGDSGVSGSWNAYGSLVARCVIRDILNVGIAWNEDFGGPGGTVIENNRLERIGTVPGLGGSGSWHAAGVIISNANEGGQGVRFRRNRVSETGYAGIILGSDRQTVEQNVFARCMSTLNDGAAVYANAHTNAVRENIILDTIGDLDSSHPWTPLGHGIWIEFLNNFRGSEIVGNTVWGSGGNGLFLPNNFACRVESNVFLSNRLGGIHLGGHEDGRSDGLPQQSHVIADNVLGIGLHPWSASEPEHLEWWADPDDNGLTFAVHGDRDLDFGAMSGTTFVTPDSQDLVLDSSGAEYTIADWQAAEAAWADPAPRVVEGFACLFINDTPSPIQFPLPEGVQWRDLWHAAVMRPVSIAPFRSVVLLASGGEPSPPASRHLASEYGIMGYTDWAELHLLPVDDAAPGADADGDGTANVLEYLFDLPPDQPNPRPSIRCDRDPDSGQARVVIERRRHVAGAACILEQSDDLATWTESTDWPLSVSDIPGRVSRVSARWTLPPNRSRPCFLRVRAAF